MARGLEFGSDPELYDAARPNYRGGLESKVMDLCVQQAQLMGKVVVEIGLGTGLGTEALLSRGVSVVGVEPDTRMLQVAKQRLGANLAASEEEFKRQVAEGHAAVRIINDTFGGSVYSGELQGPYDGVVAVTAIHWAIKECGLEATSEMIAGLLKPGGHLAILHNPIDSCTEKAAQFVRDSHSFWPESYFADQPNRLEFGLRRAEDIPPKDFSPHLRAVSYDTWTVEEELSVDDYLKNIATFYEILELNEEVRAQFFEEYRRLSQKKYHGKVPVGRGILLQIDQK